MKVITKIDNTKRGMNEERPSCSICGARMNKDGRVTRQNQVYQRWNCYPCSKQRKQKKQNQTKKQVQHTGNRRRKILEKVPQVFSYGRSYGTYDTTYVTERPSCPLCFFPMRKATDKRNKTSIRWYCGGCKISLYAFKSGVTPLRHEETRQQVTAPDYFVGMKTKGNQESVKVPTFRRIPWEGPVHPTMVAENKATVLEHLVTILQQADSETFMEEFRQTLFPPQVMEKIKQATGCDKWVEKSDLATVILVTLAYFSSEMAPDGTLTFTGLSFQSESELAYRLGVKPISGNALGTRMGQEKLVKGIEQYFQFSSYLVGSKVFDKTYTGLTPVYYDWVYFVKKGAKWGLCKEITTDTPAIKVGIGRDWKTMAVVSLVAHFSEHPGDRESAENYLFVNKSGVIHVSDSGPLAIPFLQTLDERNQFFIMVSRLDTQTVDVKPVYQGIEPYVIEGRKVTLLREEIVTLKTTQAEVRRCKEVTIRINGKKGRFKYVKLLTNLPVDAETIIRIGYYRWRATEIEFRIFKHEFGLDRIFLKDPNKFWPLLLLVLITVNLLTFLFFEYHVGHGGMMPTSKECRKALRRFILAVVRRLGSPTFNPFTYLPKCESPLCPCGRKPRQRRK